jgi:glycosyltransferase involved in cell wall biosynthesis
MLRVSNEVVLLASSGALLLTGASLLLHAFLSRRRAPPLYANVGPLFRDARAIEGGRIPVALTGPDRVARLCPSASSRRYCLITPCRDEARYARRTLDAITQQTEPPALWVIVDDGSKDATPQILEEYAARFPFIKVVRRPDRGVRKVGGGVIEAFYAGYDTIDPSKFDYVCKLDLDLDIPPRYFELAMDWMERYPRIGTCSGKPYFFPTGAGDPSVQFPLTETSGLVSEMCGDEHSVGMIKLYRTECFRQIGGFAREVMWDGIDGHRCRQRGWIAVSSNHPQLRFIHLRPMGTSHKSWWTGRARHGYGQYFMGTAPMYMLASALFRMTRPPVVVGGIAMLHGYFKSTLERAPRYGDATFRHFLRRYQWACLIKGKAAATAELNARVAPRWHPAKSAAAPVSVRPRLGEILVQSSALALDKLEEALAAQHGGHAGTRLGEILVRMKALSEEEVLSGLAIQLGTGVATGVATGVGTGRRRKLFVDQASAGM